MLQMRRVCSYIFGRLQNCHHLHVEENLPPRSRPTSAPPEAGEESTDDSADEYRQARAIPQKRRRQRRRERVDDEGQVTRVGKAQRKRKVKVKKGPTEEDLLNLPPEEGMYKCGAFSVIAYRSWQMEYRWDIQQRSFVWIWKSTRF